MKMTTDVEQVLPREQGDPVNGLNPLRSLVQGEADWYTWKERLLNMCPPA